jgi:hypothetical protein
LSIATAPVRAACFFLLTMLAACGGGGSGTSGSAAPPAPPPAIPGPALTLLTPSTASLEAQRGDLTPSSFYLGHMRTNSAVKLIGYDADGASLPDWLGMEGSWVDDSVSFMLRPAHTDLVEGTYTTPLTFYALDANDNLLEVVQLQVSYVVRELVTFTATGSGSHATAIFGDSTHTYPLTAGVLADGEAWRASADAAWVHVPEDTFDGSATLAFELDSTGLAIGTYAASVTVTSVDDPEKHDTHPVSLYVSAPRFELPGDIPVLGGPTGIDDSPLQFHFSLNTGTNTYPWTAQIKSDALGWSRLDKAAGAVGSAGDTIVLDADRSTLERGSYYASLELVADVQGRQIKTSMPIRLNYEEDRLYIVDNGIAFYQFPSRSRLAADVTVINSRGRLDVPWTAQSDATWLAVTASGNTGDKLFLTASPEGLASNTVHLARVTIHSGRPGIENDETITLSFWKGDSNPVALAIDVPLERVVANPALPYLHALDGGSLRTYNIYDGSLVSTIELPITESGGLTVSSDGRTVYVPPPNLYDGDATAVDTLSGAVTQFQQTYQNRALKHWRIEGHEFFYSSPPELSGFSFLAATPDGRHAFHASNYDESNTFSFGAIEGIDYTALSAFHYPTVNAAYPWNSYGTGSVQALAAVPDKRRLLIGLQNEVRLFDGSSGDFAWSRTITGALNNVLVRRDGLVVTGAAVSDGGNAIRLFDLEGASVGTFSSLGPVLRDQLALTSDPRRLIIPSQDHMRIVELPALGSDIVP